MIQEHLYRREVTLFLQEDTRLEGINLCDVCLICPYDPLAQEILNLLSTYEITVFCYSEFHYFSLFPFYLLGCCRMTSISLLILCVLNWVIIFEMDYKFRRPKY